MNQTFESTRQQGRGEIAVLYKIARPAIRRGILWTAAAFAMQLSPAQAQQTGFSHERASIAFGAFITDRRSETRLDTDFGPGSDIQLELSGVSQWFSIDAGDASGHLRDLYLGADYRFGNRFSLGLAYNDVTMNIKAEEVGGWTGRLDWGYDGWLVYLKTEFGN